MKLSPLMRFALGVFLLVRGEMIARADDLLVAGEPIPLPGAHGKFDFLTIDTGRRRLLAAHPGNASLDVFELDQRILIKSVKTGAAQSAAVDEKANRYYVSVSKPPQLVVLDASNFWELGKVALGGPADLSAFDAQHGRLYVGHDDARELWVLDPLQLRVLNTVVLPQEAPEDLGFDTGFTRLFQSIKTADAIAVIDLASDKVVATWPTAPAQAPHGMASLPAEDAFLVAGGNGKLVMMSQKDGSILSSTNIPAKVDQIAYDADWHRVYCASSTGRIAVVSVERGKLATLGEIASSEGCHSITVDMRTHTVWAAYAKGDESFLQPFTEQK